MENQNDKGTGRWLSIKHDACSAVFTINTQKFEDSFQDLETDRTRSGLKCPNCNELVLPRERLERVLRLCEDYNRVASYKDTIREINPKAMDHGGMSHDIRVHHMRE